jgi:hypothetical protein
MPGGMLRGRRVDHVMGEILDRGRQHARVRGGRRARQNHRDRRSRGGQPSAASHQPATSAAAGRLAGQRQGAGRRAVTGEGSQRCCLAGQLNSTWRCCQPDKLAGQNMHPRRGIGGEGPPVKDHVEQQVVVVPACQAGHRNPGHLA